MKESYFYFIYLFTFPCPSHPDPHIRSIVRNAAVRSLTIRRSFATKSVSFQLHLFKVFVRPLLDYCTSVWSPQLLQYSKLVESVQRRFTKYLPGYFDISYDDRCRKLGITTLSARRALNDLCLVFKIVKGLVHVRDVFGFELVTRCNRSHCLSLKVIGSSKNVRHHFFVVRIIRLWNSLPNDIVSAPSAAVFRARVSRWFGARL